MKVGLMGTGLMGLPMVYRFLQAGLAVMAYNRTASKLESLESTDAEVVIDPGDLVTQSDCILLMLTNAAAIQAVLLSNDLQPHLTGRTIIQMGTIAPTESRSLQKQIEASGGSYLEAPVLGSIPQVKSGTLQIMVGSTEAQFQQWTELLQHLGQPQWIGPVGTAAALKLALNQLIASLTMTFATSLGFVQQQGGDIEKFMQILRDSALYAPTFDKKLQRMLEGNYENPNFPVKHLLKDTNLFLQESESLQLQTNFLREIQAILEQTIELGRENQDYSALFEGIKSEGTQAEL
ncbi:MAG: NAD(P)-dependent oxidoreductase [Microcoleaceae cyanobacterium]